MRVFTSGWWACGRREKKNALFIIRYVVVFVFFCCFCSISVRKSQLQFDQKKSRSKRIDSICDHISTDACLNDVGKSENIRLRNDGVGRCVCV